ncbi:MAG: FtsW/RodA/SpoVE family cell cycle protein, partial [Bryobacteraceae bacterium]
MRRGWTDWWLVGAFLALLVFGLIMVWSATQYLPPGKFGSAGLEPLPIAPPETLPEAPPPPVLAPVSGRAWKQAGWAALGWLFLLALWRVDYRRLNHPAVAFGGTGLALALLGVVWFADASRHRFLRLGPVGVQPSELAKPALVIFVAFFLAQRSRILNDSRTMAPAALTLALLTGAVMVADLGTAFVMIVTAGAVFTVAGLEWRRFRTALVVGTVLTLAAMLGPGYRRARVAAFLLD